MASGRLVKGKTKQGEEVAVEISLSAHEFEGEKHTFATVVDVNDVISESCLFLERSNRLQRAVDASNDGIWEWNVQNDNVWYSPRLLTMIGQSDYQGSTGLELWLSHVHPTDKTFVQNDLSKHFEDKKKYDVV
jgi:PAS domain-containing protein